MRKKRRKKKTNPAAQNLYLGFFPKRYTELQVKENIACALHIKGQILAPLTVIIYFFT